MPILDANSFDFISRSADQTKRLGMRLGSILEREHLICLEGDLGSGKTTFVQGVASGWGTMDAVTSPTFVIVNVYRRTDDELLSHVDAYRLGNAAEFEMMDIEEMQISGPLIIEWAPKILQSLPNEYLYIKFEHIDEESRQLNIKSIGKQYQLLLENYQQKIMGGR
jgi:tRNA threonylcarbamoyladenosine biosynthesis protein TsaE